MITKAGGRVGVYVDSENLARNGGYGMRYDMLREFAARDGGDPIRLNAYVAFDRRRSEQDSKYKTNAQKFHSALRDFGFKVIQKEVKWYEDESGARYAKANADLDMAVDALLQSDNLDRVLLVTGDGDFVQVVRSLQNKGCRVEVVAFENVSADLKREADLFMSGYLIPNLLPVDEPQPPDPAARAPWGEVGSRVRGCCYSFSHDRHFGFMRFLKTIGPGLWNIDSRHKDSPYASAFAHDSEFPAGFPFAELPSRDYIFEFTISAGDRGLVAKEVSAVRFGNAAAHATV